MKFGPVAVEDALGKILGHNIAGADGRRALRKGTPLTEEDVATLRRLGRTTVYVAALAPDDVDENEAARRVTAATAGAGLRRVGPSTGRVNLLADRLGVLRVDAARLARLNSCAGLTVATLHTHTAVSPKKMVATIKILPYGVPEATVQAAEAIAAEAGPIIRVDPLPPRRVALVLSGSPTAQERIVNGFDPPLRGRLEGLNAMVTAVEFIPLEDESGEAALAACLQQQCAAGAELIVLAGETAIMDVEDIAPRAVVRAGGEITCFGAPVDPGNLLLLAYLGDVPVMGAPGCARSPKINIVDKVLPRLLVGDRLTAADVFAWGHGGLLEDVVERPYPRSKLRDS